jgi:hypothetical protein
VTAPTQPFEVPKGWTWVRLDALSRLITKGSSPKWQGVNYVSPEDGILFVTSENVGNYKLRKLDDLKYVEVRFRDIEPRSMLKQGDILMNLVGASIGRTGSEPYGIERNSIGALIHLDRSKPRLRSQRLLRKLKLRESVEAAEFSSHEHRLRRRYHPTQSKELYVGVPRMWLTSPLAISLLEQLGV